MLANKLLHLSGEMEMLPFDKFMADGCIQSPYLSAYKQYADIFVIFSVKE